MAVANSDDQRGDDVLPVEALLPAHRGRRQSVDVGLFHLGLTQRHSGHCRRWVVVDHVEQGESKPRFNREQNGPGNRLRSGLWGD